jgi:type II secretion system protein H
MQPTVRAIKPGPARVAGGFTLIELMVVMVLIGILTAMIIPEMRGTYEDALLRSTSRELVNVFQLAYSRAVSHNQIHRVRLQESSGRYLIETRAGASHGNEFLPVRDLAGAKGKLDARISLAVRRLGEDSSEPAAAEPRSGPLPDSSAAAGESTISFYPDGTADGTEVELRDRQGFRLVLRINRVTARVHIVERPRE